MGEIVDKWRGKYTWQNLSLKSHNQGAMFPEMQP